MIYAEIDVIFPRFSTLMWLAALILIYYQNKLRIPVSHVLEHKYHVVLLFVPKHRYVTWKTRTVSYIQVQLKSYIMRLIIKSINVNLVTIGKKRSVTRNKQFLNARVRRSLFIIIIFIIYYIYWHSQVEIRSYVRYRSKCDFVSSLSCHISVCYSSTVDYYKQTHEKLNNLGSEYIDFFIYSNTDVDII